MSQREWPSWWAWELELSPHLFKRMMDRGFSEVDLRTMLAKATSLAEDVYEGRWALACRHYGRPWEVIVEPDAERMLVVVVTAFPIG